MIDGATTSTTVDPTVYQRPVELLQQLIRFNTSNPPGNERACIQYIADLLTAEGIENHQYYSDPQRPNLVARLRGKPQREGGAAPLLLYGHVDVVPAQAENWTHPPFEGQIADGFLWGRGTLDMKGGVVMMLCAFIRAKKENLPLPGDVILCLLSDEEERGECGAGFMVEKHPELFDGVRYALGEVGGFTFYVSGKKFYFIEVAQKQKCGLKATIKGFTGHGSSHLRGGAMARLGQFLTQLDHAHFPIHVTPAAQMMIGTLSRHLPFPNNRILAQLLNPKRAGFVLRKILGKKGDVFEAVLCNTVNATIVNGGDKLNAIPGEIQVKMDVRLVPGCTPRDAIKELQQIVGDDIPLEVLVYNQGPDTPDMGLYETLASIIKTADPEGIPVPILMTGSSDARFFSRLGIQTYGFLPMNLPPDIQYHRILHSEDERIPLDTLPFGIDALYSIIKSFPER